MNDQAQIRESVSSDLAAIEALYPEAFPDENLVPLVRELLRDTSNVVSLVATTGSQISGHAAFSRCGISGSDANAALLGPLAVAPALQRRGIGSAIVHTGLQRMRDSGVSIVCVLGDPGYYSRLGFVPDSSIEPPYRLPAEWLGAWQSRRIDDVATPVAGRLIVPQQWLDPALWAP